MTPEPHFSPADRMPWPVQAPFRMRPGLSRLAPDQERGVHEPAAAGVPLFLRDALAPVYAVHKAEALVAHRVQTQVGQAEPAVLQAVADAYAAQTGVHPAAQADALALGLQEDFVVLHDEPDGFRTRFLSVCFPSNWSPAEKLGLDFTAIHAPVADNALLQAGARGITDMAFRQAPMLRHVWLLTPGAGLPQHPDSRRRRWEDALAQAEAAGGRLIDQLCFRVERQTTLPLPALKRGVFFIRVMVCPLNAVLAVAPERTLELHAAIESMSTAVLAYRGMAAVRERLLRELAALP